MILPNFVVIPVHAENEARFYALLVCGEPGLEPDTYYMCRILVDCYGFDNDTIYYIDTEPSPQYCSSMVDATIITSIDVVRSAITNWLKNHSGPNDTIFMYFASHGGGYDSDQQQLMGGIAHVGDPDEGNETLEEHLLDPMPPHEPIDVNNDTDTSDWVGVDETIILKGKMPNHGPQIRPLLDYSDDQLADDLSCLDYETLIFIGMGCYLGGLIDDISDPNRIIMTATNETCAARSDRDDDGFSEWTESFQDALYGEEMNWSGSELVHTGIPVNADENEDDHVSMWEAWNYTWYHDDARLSGDETPWLDDNGNGLPTYKNEMEYGTPYDNGTLADKVWLPRHSLTVQTEEIGGPEFEGVGVWIDGEYVNTSRLTTTVTPGNHTVNVESPFYQSGYEYTFHHWNDNTTDNPRNVNVTCNMSITAYYNKVVAYNVTVQTNEVDGSEFEGTQIYIDGEYAGTSRARAVGEGNHTVKVASPIIRGNHKYTFEYWENNSTNNPRNITVTGNMNLTAYYSKTLVGGGCPFVFVWNGSEYVMDNNLLPTSELGNGTDVNDYYRLEQLLVPFYTGRWFSWYSLQISEFENEHSYIDQAKLIAVDHDSDVNIAVTPSGEILTYRNPEDPVSCIDNNGTNRLDEILQMDGNVSDPTTYFYGTTGDYLILNFGQIDSENAKLILRDDMKSHEICIHVQIKNAEGEWETSVIVSPRDYWATEAVDLSEYLVQSEDFMVRLVWTSPHRLDYVGLDTTPQASITKTYTRPISAIHSIEGDVTNELFFNDQVYAELVPGEQIQLIFTLPNTPQTKTRTIILYTNGHYYTL